MRRRAKGAPELNPRFSRNCLGTVTCPFSPTLVVATYSTAGDFDPANMPSPQWEYLTTRVFAFLVCRIIDEGGSRQSQSTVGEWEVNREEISSEKSYCFRLLYFWHFDAGLAQPRPNCQFPGRLPSSTWQRTEPRENPSE
jgi:hypothetical protein